MANVATTSGLLGALNLDSRILIEDGESVSAEGQAAEFEANTTVIGNDGFTYRYVQAGGAIAASQTDITVSAAGQATDGSGAYISSAVAFVDNEFGWVKSVTQVADAAA